MPSSSDFAGGVDDRELLGLALQRLDPRQRAVIVLHYYLGMPLSEVAGVMGIPLGTAQSRLHYALNSMRSSVIERAGPRAGAASGRDAGMNDDRFEKDLPGLLAELAPRAKPDYRDDIVRQTARTRQRPAWMFPERWIPMSVTHDPCLRGPTDPVGGSWGSSPSSSSPLSPVSRWSRARSDAFRHRSASPPTASSRTRTAATSSSPTRKPAPPRPS